METVTVDNHQYLFIEEYNGQEPAILQGEMNGVRWYCKRVDRCNVRHFIVLPAQQDHPQRIIRGGWSSGRYVFHQLATLQGEEKEAFIHHIEA